MDRIKFSGTEDDSRAYLQSYVQTAASTPPPPAARPAALRLAPAVRPDAGAALALLPTADAYAGYRGGLHGGLPQGVGRLVVAGGAAYDGRWEAGLPHGRGALLLPAGNGTQRRYEGTFWRGEAHGVGTCVTLAGNLALRTVKGDFRRGWAHGHVAIFAADGGLFYRGDAAYGVPHGRGCANLPGGGGYEGDFVDGRPQGRGALAMASGDRWEGEMRDGRPDGLGRLRRAAGQSFEGVSRDNEVVTGAWLYRSGQAEVLQGPIVYGDGRVAMRAKSAATGWVLPLATASGAAEALAGRWLAEARRGSRGHSLRGNDAEGNITLRVEEETLTFLGWPWALRDRQLAATLRALDAAALLAKKATAGDDPASATTLEGFKLAAWQPDRRLLGALGAVRRRIEAAGDAGSPAAANLVRALLMLQGPALAFSTRSPTGDTEAYPSLLAYATQLAFVSDVLLDAPHYQEVVLDAGAAGRPPTTLLFHVESFAERGPALRGIVESLCAGFALAHAADESLADGDRTPMVDALLERINDRGPCLDGRVSAMQQALYDLGLAADDAELVPDLAGKDPLAQCSEHLRVFQLRQLRAFAADRGVPPVKALVLAHPDFAAQYVTEARFRAHFAATPAGAALDAATFERAIRHQTEVLGLL